MTTLVIRSLEISYCETNIWQGGQVQRWQKTYQDYCIRVSFQVLISLFYKLIIHYSTILTIAACAFNASRTSPNKRVIKVCYLTCGGSPATSAYAIPCGIDVRPTVIPENYCQRLFTVHPLSIQIK